jgi:DnaJ-class molecular chaperone
MQFQDYYEVLGVPRDADAEAIKKAYRALALRWHPDRHQGDAKADAEQRFKAASEAYEVLSDPAKRQKYDRFGKDWQHGQDFQPPPPGQGGARRMSREEFEQAFGGAGGFSDFFREMFGEDVRRDFGGRARSHARFDFQGADVRAELELPIGAALEGGVRTFQVPGQSACRTCGGTGFVGEHVCPTCAGVGSVRALRTVELRIPASVRDGLELRLKGLGEPGQGQGGPGDLYLTLRLVDDERYALLEGGELEVRVRVAPWTAELGGSVDVRTARGTVALKVPPGSRSGARLRLRGQGLADGSGGHGDCIARLELDLPESLSARQRELLSQLAAEDAGGARP